MDDHGGLSTLGAAPGRLRDDPDFRRYWLARMVSQTGGMVTLVAMPVLVYSVTGSSLWTAFVTVAEGLPYLFLGLPAGAYADRLDRRRIMIGADLANAALLASVPAAYALGALSPVHVLVVAFGTHSLFVFFDAANFGALPTLVGRERVGAAMAAVFGSSSVVELVVPALAGVALVVVAPAPMIALDAVGFFASALLIRAIVRPLSDRARTAAAKPRLRADIHAGLRFLWSEPAVRVMTAVGAVQAFAGGAFVGQMVPWGDQVLGIAPTGDGRLGVLFSGWALGGLVASALLPRLLRRFSEARITLLLLPASGGLGVLTCLTEHWLLAAAGLFGWGVAYLLVMMSALTLRQRITPEHLLSRVNATGRMLSFGIGSPVGAFAGGLVATVAGPRAAIVVGAAVLLVAAVLAWFSPLRRLAKRDTGASGGESRLR
jgi:MFS family permease